MLFLKPPLLAPGIPLWKSDGVTFSKTDPPVIMITCKRTRIALQTSGDAFTDSPQLAEKYENLTRDSFGMPNKNNMDIMAMHNAIRDYNNRMEEFLLWIAAAEPLEKIMRDIHAEAAQVKPTMQHFLCPDKKSFVVKGISEKLIAEPTDVNLFPPELSGVSLAPEKHAGLAVLSPAELEVEDETALKYEVTSTRVILPDGTTAWFKKYASVMSQYLAREIDSYNKIKEASFQDEDAVRTPKLLGLVKGDVKDEVYGLLLSNIVSGPRSNPDHILMHERMELTNKLCGIPDLETSLREKWKRQITQTLHKLHAAGITWKNPTPDNILIDAYDDAWIVSFGSEGKFASWVPQELVGTVEGDLHGLSLICRFIDGENQDELMCRRC